MNPRTYQRRIRRLRQMLADVEWVQPTYNGSPSCSYCGNQQHWGHATDCALASELGRPVGVPVDDEADR